MTGLENPMFYLNDRAGAPLAILVSGLNPSSATVFIALATLDGFFASATGPDMSSALNASAMPDALTTALSSILSRSSTGRPLGRFSDNFGRFRGQQPDCLSLMSLTGIPQALPAGKRTGVDSRYGAKGAA